MPSAATADIALITPSVLTWAIDRSPLGRDVIAKRLNVPANVLKSWETKGGPRPPFAKAEALASLLHVPFGVLYLPKPPQGSLPLPDFRTLEKDYQPSQEFLQLLNDVLVKQEWFREFAVSTGTAKPLPFVGKFTIDSPVADVAADIRRVLGIDASLRNSVGSWSEYLSTLARHAEDNGILVMRSSVVGNTTTRKVSIREVQGFAVVDPIAPVVFINSADFKAPQIFTFAHELAHIWIGKSAIDNPDPVALRKASKLEEFCNDVATSVLVPLGEFAASWKANRGDRRLAAVARRFWVSSLVVLRRALETGEIDEDEFLELRAEELAKVQKKSSGGGDFYRNIVVRMGARLTYAVLGEINRDRLSLLDGSRLLGVRVATLVKFAEMAR